MGAKPSFHSIPSDVRSVGINGHKKRKEGNCWLGWIEEVGLNAASLPPRRERNTEREGRKKASFVRSISLLGLFQCIRNNCFSLSRWVEMLVRVCSHGEKVKAAFIIGDSGSVGLFFR